MADPDPITKAMTNHGAGIQENTSRLAMPRNVPVNDRVTVRRIPNRSAAHPAVMIPKMDKSPALPKADAAASEGSPDSTRKGTSCVITANVVIDVKEKSRTICQYSRV